MQSGWYTELVIRNNYSHESLAVTPVLLTFSGNEVPLPAVTLGANEVKGIDLREALPKYAPQLLKSHGNYGSVVFRFNSPTIGSIFAFTMVHSGGHPFAFHFDAEQRLNKFDGGAWETIWWLPKPSTDGLLVLSNASGEPVSGELQFSDAAGKTVTKQVAFGPRQTRLFNLREEFITSKVTSSYGGLRFVINKGGGDLQPIAFIYDETDGFSAVLKTFHHPMDAPAQKVTLRAPMMALAAPDPALGFPEGTKLVPRVYVRNTTTQAVVVAGFLNWKSGTSTGRQALSLPRLEAGQTYLLDISGLQKQGNVPADANWGTVSLSYQGKLGDVIPIAASYETDGRFGVQTPFSHQITRYWKGGRWEVDPVHNSLITIGNGGDEPTTAAVTFYYNGGKDRYELPKRRLAAGEQMWVDVGKLILQQLPDAEGRTIPLGTTFGAYDAVDLDHKAIGQLYEGKIIVDKKHGHAAYGCMHCCGYWETYILPSSKSIFTYASNQTVVLARDCNNYEMIITELATGWHSANTQIATVDTGGIVSGQGAGSTSVDSYQYLASQNNYDCSGESFYQEQSVAVQPVIDSISPGIRDINSGGSFTMTISGAGFGTSPVVNLPAQVSSSNQSSTSTSIQFTASIGIDANIGVNSITVTAGGQQSAPKYFVIDGPHHLRVVSDQMGNCTNCTSSVKRVVTYQIVKYSGSDSDTVYVGEAVTLAGWSCSENFPGISTTSCSAAQPAVAGVFPDIWTLGADYTPTSCGLNTLDVWKWCGAGAPTNPRNLATLSGFIHTDAVKINNSTNPPEPMLPGTEINP